jgi:hypothetical protein
MDGCEMIPVTQRKLPVRQLFHTKDFEERCDVSDWSSIKRSSFFQEIQHFIDKFTL